MLHDVYQAADLKRVIVTGALHLCSDTKAIVSITCSYRRRQYDDIMEYAKVDYF